VKLSMRGFEKGGGRRGPEKTERQGLRRPGWRRQRKNSRSERGIEMKNTVGGSGREELIT
jgi:hypothetical protein